MALVTKFIRGLGDPIWPLYFAAFLLPLMLLVLLIASLLKGGVYSTPDRLTIVLAFLAGVVSLCLAVFRQDLSRLRSSRSTFLRSGPLIINVNSQDLAAVTKGMPAYVLYGLTDCVDEVFKKPTVVFPGSSSGSLKGGLVFCGKPARFFDNNHSQLDAPSDMIYMAYVNRSLYLFDWDWVPEDPDQSGYPAGWETRFLPPLPEPPKATLKRLEHLVPSTFKYQNAWYSTQGDCIFWYSSDDPAFAERVNDDLTLFKSLSDRSATVGAKLKNIERVLSMRRLSLEQLRYKPLVVIIAESLAYQAENNQPTDHYPELIQTSLQHLPLIERTA